MNETSTRSTGRRVIVRSAAAVLLLVAALAPSSIAQDAAGGIDIQLREQFDEIVGRWAESVWDEKNDAGDRFQRASFSKNYRKVDDGTYKVAYTRDTVFEDGTRMRTELCEATLSRASGKWELTDHVVNRTYEKLVRDKLRGHTSHRFESFAFEREGLTIRASNGTLVLDYLDGELEEIALAADDLTYAYEPPTDLSYHQRQIWDKVRDDSEFKDDFEFKVAAVFVSCDATTCRDLLDGALTGVTDATDADLDGKLRNALEDSIDETQKRLKDNPFYGFRLPMEQDREYLQVALKKDGKRMGRDHYLWLNYDTYSPVRVQFGASAYGSLFAYPSEAERAAGIEPHELETRDDPGSRYYQLVGLEGTVKLATETSELVKADLVYDMEIKRDVEELPFYLNNVRGFGGASTGAQNASITIDAVQMNGEDLMWVRRGNSSGLIVFPEPLRAGDRVQLHMKFQNEGSIVKVTPSYSYMDRSGWLPLVQFTDKIENFDLTVHAPARYKTLGIGTKVSERVEGDVRITQWTSESPVTFPTVIFGDYVEVTPKTEAAKADGTPIPVTIHVDKDGMQQWEIRPKQLKPLAEQAVNALNLFREIYGMDYPYGKLDLVNDPLGFLYGQAPASIVYLGSGAFRGTGMLASAGVAADSSYITKFTDTLVAHEVAHQWWGALVGNANQRNYWFVESLAEYSAALYLEAVTTQQTGSEAKGYEAYLDHVDGWRRAIMNTEMTSSVQDASFLWSNGGYQAAVYSKGPYAVHILRMTFGYEKTVEFLRNVAQELGNKEIVTRDIQRVAEKTFGGTMDWFFDQWIRGIGIPEYRLNWTARKAEDGNYIVEGDVTQRIVAGGNKKYVLDGATFRGVVTLTVIGHDRKEYGPVRFLVEDETTPFALPFPVEPREVILNKDGEMLSYDVVVNRPFDS